MTESAIAPGSRVAHYRFEEKIGAGGNGEVYRAVDLTLERNVALKILPPSLLHDVDRVRRFVQEARSASALNHPHIVTIYEIGQGDVASGVPGDDPHKVHYIAMEYIDGRTLRSMIREKEPLAELLAVLAQAADGLAKAHGAGIVHRDLKPDNIMVTSDGYTKVVDFGLAKLTDEAQQQRGAKGDSMLTARGIVVGTLGYMAPEQVEGKPVNAAADVFAFGCILYECVAGKRPFEADLAIDTLHRIIFSEPLPLPTVRPDVDPQLAALVDACLRKRPEDRIGSMREVASALRGFATSDPQVRAAAITPPLAARPVMRSIEAPGEPLPRAAERDPGDSPTHRAAAAAGRSPRRRGALSRGISLLYRTALVVVVASALYVGATMPDLAPLASGRVGEVDRWTDLDRVSSSARKAVIAFADPEFHRRRALDPAALKKTASALLTDERSRYAPSPIAKRVAGELYPTSRLNPLQPLREWVIATQLQRRLDSKRLLELYVNLVPFGEARGIESAARKYFDKSAAKLNRDEAAMLSTLADSGAFDPAAPSPDALAAKASILRKMAE
jgi:serine/threonine protein kinase